MPNVPLYGPFVKEWGAIYERFGVPADIGLAQAVLESGFDGTARSKANALGLCQWLRRNWQVLDDLSPVKIEAYNQTTQAPYCAAYLSILSTMYVLLVRGTEGIPPPERVPAHQPSQRLASVHAPLQSL